MSLLSTASIWTNDEPPKKRIPTMRKTIKKPPSDADNLNSTSTTDDINEYQQPPIESMTDVQTSQESRTSHINNLLNQINIDNDGNNLVDFKPLSYSTSPQNSLSTAPLQVSSPFHIQQEPSNFTANTTNIAKLSNYNQSYDPPKNIVNTHYSNLGLGNGNPDTKLMEKINYMIHMLEQQQGEQTQNITEEFILYTFLGVFVIFIVDSFARSGRYIR